MKPRNTLFRLRMKIDEFLWAGCAMNKMTAIHLYPRTLNIWGAEVEWKNSTHSFANYSSLTSKEIINRLVYFTSFSGYLLVVVH